MIFCLLINAVSQLFLLNIRLIDEQVKINLVIALYFLNLLVVRSNLCLFCLLTIIKLLSEVLDLLSVDDNHFLFLGSNLFFLEELIPLLFHFSLGVFQLKFHKMILVLSKFQFGLSLVFFKFELFELVFNFVKLVLCLLFGLVRLSKGLLFRINYLLLLVLTLLLFSDRIFEFIHLLISFCQFLLWEIFKNFAWRRRVTLGKQFQLILNFQLLF